MGDHFITLAPGSNYVHVVSFTRIIEVLYRSLFTVTNKNVSVHERYLQVTVIISILISSELVFVDLPFSGKKFYSSLEHSAPEYLRTG